MTSLERWRRDALEHVRTLPNVPALERVGRLESVADGVASVSGLADGRLDEVVTLADGVLCQIVDLGRTRVGCVLLDDRTTAPPGTVVRGAGDTVRIPVGEALLGRVIDPLGRALDGAAPIASGARAPLDAPAPPLAARALVRQPLETGTAVVDAMFPIGRGQRELILGDRATGKTTLAVDAIINQRRSDVVCIYVAIGQKASSIARVVADIRRHGAWDRCIVVAAEAERAPGLQWLAPNAGFTVAEWFAARGGHALVVLDDLTKHAAIHRQIALLLGHPPGREAYPGDVFHIHARLLERAAQRAESEGGGSVTALPIAETQEGNLSAYLPTNLISITDGQIVLDARLFHAGQKPAVDVGLSVSRVGGKTQRPAMRALAEPLRLGYAQFLELELFSRFGSLVDERTAHVIDHGRRVRALLTQTQLEPLPAAVQVAMLLALGEGILDRLPPEGIRSFRTAVAQTLAGPAAALAQAFEATGALENEARAAWLKVLSGLADGPGARA